MPPNTGYRGYSFELDRVPVLPVALVIPPEQDVVTGSIVKLDGSASVDSEGRPLTYEWSFIKWPIGSQVAQFGFTSLESDNSIVSFSPDVDGHYEVGLVVSNGSIDSSMAVGSIDVRRILVPFHRGIIPDASFIWRFLSDFWPLVEDRVKFETIWSALIQITSAELHRVLQIDYNKSIRDIQEVFQRLWLSYSLYLELDNEDVSFVLADDQAGVTASTLLVDPDSGVTSAVQPDYSSLVLVPISEGNFNTTSYGQNIYLGRLIYVGGRSFTMGRATPLAKASNYGLDGAAEATPAFPSPNQSLQFTGSGFTTAMVGSFLKILSVTNQGTYVISEVIDSQTVKVHTTTGGTPTWVAATGQTYSVVPKTPQHSAFFADQDQVPTKLFDYSWRFSSILISESLDFEAQGVSPGDIIEVEVRRVDNQVSETFPVQVVSVDRNKVGFVFNVADLVDGTAAGGLDDVAQRKLADRLRIPGLLDKIGGGFLYSDQAKLIRDTIRSFAFKRKYFERELSPSDEISVGGGLNVLIRPVRIIRTRAFPVHEDVVSVPVLQEYVKQPDVAKQGDTIYQVTREGLVELDHEPYLLVENLDYIIDDEATIRGACDLKAGDDVITVPFGDLLERSVQEGDTITVTAGAFQRVFTVYQVVDAEKLKVIPIPQIDATQATFKLRRRIPGKLLRFVKGTFNKNRLPPQRFWAEVTYFDNSQAIEDNFGLLVGVTKDQLDTQEADINYKAAVHGLMYARTTGAFIGNLTLAAQILFGLPFTQARGRITEINPDYRLRPDGSRLLGRILIEAIDDRDEAIGLTNIYFYPHGRQLEAIDDLAQITGLCDTQAGSDNVVIKLGALLSRDIRPGDIVTLAGSAFTIVNVLSDEVLRVQPAVPTTNIGVAFLLERQVAEQFVPATPESSGLGINPKTGVEFQVGDIVDAFVPLSKGIIFDEYLLNPTWYQHLIDQGSFIPELEKFHSFRILANADTITAADVDLVAGFIKSAKASAKKLGVGVLRSLEDTITIKDDFTFALGRPPVFYENLSFSLPVAAKFDKGTGDESILNVDGEMYARYISGEDLITTKDSDQAVSPGGGFITARVGFAESHDEPFLQAGDLLVIRSGFNVGHYPIIAVIDDSTLQVDLDGGVFLSSDAQQFAVYRPIKNPIFRGTASVTTADPLVPVTPGTTANIFSAGVAVGDIAILINPLSPSGGVSRRYTITEIDLIQNELRLSPAPSEANGSYDLVVIREGLLTKYFLAADAAALPHFVDVTSGSNLISFYGATSDKASLAMLRPGDVIVCKDTTVSPAVFYYFTVKAWAPQSLTAVIFETPTITRVNAAARIERPNRPTTVISTDLLARMPEDVLFLDLLSSYAELETTNGSAIVTLSGLGIDPVDFIDLGILPGDYLLVREGPDSTRDVSYGAGVYPIKRVISSSQLELTEAMTTTFGPGSPILYGLRRKRVNDG